MSVGLQSFIVTVIAALGAQGLWMLTQSTPSPSSPVDIIFGAGVFWAIYSYNARYRDEQRR